MKIVLLILIFFLKNRQVVVDEPPTHAERIFAILFILLLLGSTIAIYFIVRSKRVLQSKFETIEKQSHAIGKKNDKLVFTNDSLRLISDEKSNMISVVAHDLKTPLGNVEGLATLISMEKDTLSATQQEYLDLIIETSRRAQETIDIMLDVHKIESEIHVVNRVNHNFIDLIKEVIDTNSIDTKTRNVEIELVDNAKTKQINTDGNYFKQIISNILSNAIRYSPKNGKVIILVTEKEQSIRFDISDSGPGIDESTKKRLFTSYAKIEIAKEDKLSGMGLYIARKLVEKLNGKIRLESTSEEGTTFSVEFFK